MQWSALIHTRFHVSGATRDTARPLLDFNYGSLTLCGSLFQTIHLSIRVPRRGPHPERINPSGLDSSPFARHYLGNRFRFLLLRLLRCFTSAGLAPLELSLFIPRSYTVTCRGFPHSDIPGLKPACG